MTDTEIINFILTQPEGQGFECKRAAAKPSRFLETVVAFANADGGLFVIGIEDPAKASGLDRLIGISEGRDNVSDFFKLLDREIDPQLPAIQKFEIVVTNHVGQQDSICLVAVNKSNDVHSLKNGDTYMRVGNQNAKIGSTQIVRLKYAKGTICYESETTGIETLDVLEMGLLEKYKTDTGSYAADIWQFLKDNGLALISLGQSQLTKGCVHLFSKNPAVILGTKCSIKISHYHGLQQTFTGEPNFVRRPFTIEGPLMQQITQAGDYFRNVVRSSPPKLSGGTFRPTMLIPEWVFQEAITNAVIHRDYSLSDDIHIRIFDNRVEIESPGSYPGHITPANIRQERFARNPLILRVLNRFSNAPNLDIGEGVDRMFQLMRALNLYEPLYLPAQLKPHSVMVVLFNLQRIEYWDTVSHYLDKHLFITNKKARAVTGINDTLKMSKLLRTWLEQGLLEKQEIGGKKGTTYNKPGALKLDPLFSKGLDNSSKNRE